VSGCPRSIELRRGAGHDETMDFTGDTAGSGATGGLQDAAAAVGGSNGGAGSRPGPAQLVFNKRRRQKAQRSC
jgi:hypothetical protein